MIIEWFGVSPEDADILCRVAHRQGEVEPTRVMQLTHWGVVRLKNQGIVKRTGPNEYAHIDNPKPGYTAPRLSSLDLRDAMVSVKILKNEGWEPERIMLELSQWDDDVIEAAIKRVFSAAELAA